MRTFIKIRENNAINLDMMINLYLDPLNIYIPITKKEVLKKNNYVYKNTYFNNYISSVSGHIKGAKKIYINNKAYPALEIANDFKENTLDNKKINKIKTKDDLITTLQNLHLDSLANKISNKNIKNLVIKAIDNDIFVYNELMILTNYASKICETLDIILKILSLDKATIAIKNTLFQAIKNIKSIIGTYPNINLQLLNDYYLIYYDKFICQELNIEEDKTLILTSQDIFNLYTLFKGNYINETFITISGNAIEKSIVVKTRIGVLVKELIDKLIKIKDSDYDIYLNGYIKGLKIDNLESYIITSDIKSIIINKRKEKKEYACINCGGCLKVCPFNINILKYIKENKKNKDCNGCSLCNYICPSNINLKEKIYGGKNE